MQLKIALMVLASTACVMAQRGPDIGTRVPDFQTVDQAGTSRTLASSLGPKGGLLVFFRSADW